MSKNTGADAPADKDRYNSSSVPAVWIVVSASLVLGAVAIFGAVV